MSFPEKEFLDSLSELTLLIHKMSMGGYSLRSLLVSRRKCDTRKTNLPLRSELLAPEHASLQNPTRVLTQ